MQTTGYSTQQLKDAERLVVRADKWAEGVDLKTGVRFNVFASESEPGAVHRTRFDGRGCSCKGAQDSRSKRCYHMLACALQTERVQEEAARPKLRYEDIFKGDGDLCTDAF